MRWPRLSTLDPTTAARARNGFLSAADWSTPDTEPPALSESHSLQRSSNASRAATVLALASRGSGKRRRADASPTSAAGTGASVGADAVAGAAWDALRGADDRRTLLSVRRDDPYQGGEIVRAFGRPADGVHALQLEVSRRLYMDERVYRVLHWPNDLRPLDATEASPSARGGTPAPDRRRARDLHELVERLRGVVRALNGTSALTVSVPDAQRPVAP